MLPIGIGVVPATSWPPRMMPTLLPPGSGAPESEFVTAFGSCDGSSWMKRL